MRIVSVTWRDHDGAAKKEWWFRAEIADVPLFELTNIGFVISDDDTSIVLAAQSRNDQFAQWHRILKPTIISVTEFVPLELGKTASHAPVL